MTILDATTHAPRPSIPVRRILLTLLVAIPYALGWSAGALVVALGWCYAALVAGWRDGHGQGRQAPHHTSVTSHE
ncbi:hypothetical protein [Actinoallomurus sp. CA-150999]|uniref:hypothetical protein n=1 Tax=Actinoallomurus sp. CA-150999 TaxID=3239887 RepID=UPI003D8F3F7C